MTTTIKVDDEVRDRLKEHAARAGLTLGGYLRKVADQADRAERFAALKRSIDRTPPDLMASYLAEVEEWETTELTDQQG